MTLGGCPLSIFCCRGTLTAALHPTPYTLPTNPESINNDRRMLWTARFLALGCVRRCVPDARLHADVLLTLCTLHPLLTLHSTPHTLHPTLYTLHPAPSTLHPTPYTLLPTLYTIPYTLHHTAACQTPDSTPM